MKRYPRPPGLEKTTSRQGSRVQGELVGSVHATPRQTRQLLLLEKENTQPLARMAASETPFLVPLLQGWLEMTPQKQKNKWKKSLKTL